MAKARTGTAKFEGVNESDLVAVTLAHPLTRKADLDRLGLADDAPEDGFAVNDVVKVRRGDAQTLINAGYAQIDPENAPAVAEALDNGKVEAQPASTSGNKSGSKSDS